MLVYNSRATWKRRQNVWGLLAASLISRSVLTELYLKGIQWRMTAQALDVFTHGRRYLQTHAHALFRTNTDRHILR